MGIIGRLSVAVALVASGAVVGCAMLSLPPGVCPAIAWFNSVEVKLTGNVSSVASLELCTDGVCAASTAASQGPLEPPHRATLGPQDLELSTAEPHRASPQATAVSPVFAVTRIDAVTWQVSTEAAPETLTLRALSSAGDVLVEREVELDWERVGGSEECGGPREAGPVSLDIPS